jgi:hypothetical protein
LNPTDQEQRKFSEVRYRRKLHVSEPEGQPGGETMLATFAFDVCHDVYRAAREVLDTKIPTLNLNRSGKYQWHPDRVPHLAEYVADFARAGQRAIEGGGKMRRSRGKSIGAGHSSHLALGASPPLRASPPGRASRMAMFRVYYLGGAEYQAARRHLGISELTWADWADEIRHAVGKEVVRAGIFPPSKYFLGSSKDRERPSPKRGREIAA